MSHFISDLHAFQQRNADASERWTDEEVSHNLIDLKRRFRRLIPTQMLLFLLARALSSGMHNRIDFHARLPALPGLVYVGGLLFGHGLGLSGGGGR